MNIVRRWMVVAVTLAALAGGNGCTAARSDTAASAGIDPAEARHFVTDYYLARAKGMEWQPGLYRTVDEMLPNVKYQMPTGELLTVSDFAVLGRITSVAKGKGFRIEGDDAPGGITTDYDDKRARWWTAHATVAVEKGIGGSAPSEIRVLFQSPRPEQFAIFKAGLEALGRVVLFIDRRTPLNDYDPSVFVTAIYRGPVVATVAEDGSLALPLLEGDHAATLLARTPTIAALEEAGAVPRIVPILGSPGNYRRADGL